MVYFLGVLMGYFIGTNTIVERQINRNVGYAYANYTIGFLSSIGGLGGWFCVLPAAYFVWSDYGNGFLEAFYFVLSFFIGAFISGMIQIPSVSRSFSPFTLPINIALTISVYSLMR